MLSGSCPYPKGEIMKGYELSAALKKLEAGWILTDPSQAISEHPHQSGLEDYKQWNKAVVDTLREMFSDQLSAMDKRVVMLEEKIKAHDKALQRARTVIKSLQG